MDSPVIVDTASKFGRGIDLDSSFPGFPFDDDGFGRRTDIRAHLDDLAARHPEFADHLIGPPWGDIPFHGSLRNRQRGSGSGGGSYQSHPDEDARSQVSGSSTASAASGASGASSHASSAASAASGASGVSSHASSAASAASGAGGVSSHASSAASAPQNYESEAKRTQIPQYGLRNTVDIGQHCHNMDNPDKGNRGQRSMSAPPENRQTCGQQQPQQEQQTQQPQGQRFVSRVDITPQNNQSPQQEAQKTPQKPQKAQQQSNVRHIPIFVEGRDEPVIPRNVNEQHFRREPSPTQFQTPPPHFRREPSPTQFQPPPSFQRPSAFGQHFGGRHNQWSPHFDETFYQPQSAFEQPTRRQQQSHSYQQPRQQQFFDKHQRPEAQHYEQQRQQPQQPKEEQRDPPPKPKQTVPKDPLERVALVQKEVDSLAEQVKKYTGNSRQDKEYMYLDEMLTRELIKLDDIETEGRDNVRQARKNAIKAIQNTISLLESMAPLPSQQNSEEVQQEQLENNTEETGQTESMEVERKEEQSMGPIPLPPCQSSPTSAQNNDAPSEEETKNISKDQPAVCPDPNPKNCQTSSEPMDTTPAQKESTPDAQRNPESQPEIQENSAEQKKANDTSQEQPSVAQEEQKPSEEKMEVDSSVKRSPKAPKKGKKAKKQTPVSEQAIPLPAPESAETSTK